MTRMADDFERADRERDLRKHDFPPLEQPDDRGGNDLLLVAFVVFGLLGSLLVALGVLIHHAANQ